MWLIVDEGRERRNKREDRNRMISLLAIARTSFSSARWDIIWSGTVALYASSVDLMMSNHLIATYIRENQFCPVLSFSTMTDFDSTHTLITEVKTDYRVLDHLDSIQTFARHCIPVDKLTTRVTHLKPISSYIVNSTNRHLKTPSLARSFIILSSQFRSRSDSSFTISSALFFSNSERGREKTYISSIAFARS